MINGIKGRSTEQPSYLGRRGTVRMNLFEIFRWMLTKQIVRTPHVLRKMKEWTLWSDQPPAKLKK
jgi:hypothetical protein